MSILTKISTSSPDPVIACFWVVWYQELSNEHENLSGSTIRGLEVDFARIVNFISIPCNGILRVFIVSGTHLLPQKCHELLLTPYMSFFLKIYIGVEYQNIDSYYENLSIYHSGIQISFLKCQFHALTRVFMLITEFRIPNDHKIMQSQDQGI